MRKATMWLLVVISLWGATSWQPPQPLPQWRVVQSVILTNQTAPIAQTTIFIPEQSGLYRLSGYMTGATKHNQQTGAGWFFQFICVDRSPDGVCGAGMETQFPSPFTSDSVYVFSPRAGSPVGYQVTTSDPPPVDSHYDLALTIEQLQ